MDVLSPILMPKAPPDLRMLIRIGSGIRSIMMKGLNNRKETVANPGNA